ncbi:MAG: hypothetical protein V4659_03600 [Pseudomonadota bacterium]
MPADNPNDPQTMLELATARSALTQAIEGAGLDPSRAGEAPVATGKGGDLSVELVLNGATIAFDGRERNVVAPDALQAFLQRQKLAVESGEMDDAIAQAIAAPGPGKATARVRAVG